MNPSHENHKWTDTDKLKRMIKTCLNATLKKTWRLWMSITIPKRLYSNVKRTRDYVGRALRKNQNCETSHRAAVLYPTPHLLKALPCWEQDRGLWSTRCGATTPWKRYGTSPDRLGGSDYICCIEWPIALVLCGQRKFNAVVLQSSYP